MRKWKYILCMFIAGCLSCQPKTDVDNLPEVEETVEEPIEIEEPEDEPAGKDECDCENGLYRYTQGYGIIKISLCDFLANDWLVVGFYIETKNNEIVDFIEQTGLFEPVDTNKIIRWDNFSDPFWESWNMPHVALLWVNTREPKTCTQLNEIIHTLEMSPMVRVADFSFCYFPNYCSNVSSYFMLFEVKVKDKNNLSDLNKMIKKTNTWIIKHYDDFLNGDIFMLGADKNSKGNARQMANYFNETGKFVGAMPLGAPRDDVGPPNEE